MANVFSERPHGRNGAVFYHNVKKTVSNICATNSGLTFGREVFSTGDCYASAQHGGKANGRSGMFRPFGAGRSDGVNPRVDPRRDLGIQIPPTGSEVDRSDEDPIIPVQRRLDEIVNLVGRLCRLHDPGRFQNLDLVFEFIDLIFHAIVVLSGLSQVVCDHVERWLGIHCLLFGLCVVDVGGANPRRRGNRIPKRREETVDN